MSLGSTAFVVPTLGKTTVFHLPWDRRHPCRPTISVLSPQPRRGEFPNGPLPSYPRGIPGDEALEDSPGCRSFSRPSSREAARWKIPRSVVFFSTPSSRDLRQSPGYGPLEDSLARILFSKPLSRDLRRRIGRRGVGRFSRAPHFLWAVGRCPEAPRSSPDRWEILRSAAFSPRRCRGRWHVGKFSRALSGDLRRRWLFRAP